MMHKMIKLVMVTSLALGAAIAQADTVDDRLAAYQAEGAGPFDATKGEAMWTHRYTHAKADKPRSCAACHTDNVRANGKHARTGKSIKPLAPSVNPERLTDAKKIEKWFRRNCKWTIGRACTAQEKGDILSYLRAQ
jgi:hypothetical protein